MAKGNSGRIVIEIDPELKQELYEALGVKELNLKQWFLSHVNQLLAERQPSLPMFKSQELSKRS